MLGVQPRWRHSPTVACFILSVSTCTKNQAGGHSATFFIHSALPLPARAFVPFAVVPCGRGIPASVPASLSTCTRKASCQTANLGLVQDSRVCIVMIGARADTYAGVTCGAATVTRFKAGSRARCRACATPAPREHVCHASHSVRLRARHEIDSPCITEKIVVSFDTQAVVPGQHARRARVILFANHVTN